jgi:hypothetical protein
MAVAIVEAGGFFTGGTVVPFKTFTNAIVSVADAGVAAFGQRVPHVGPCRDIRPTGGWLVGGGGVGGGGREILRDFERSQ